MCVTEEVSSCWVVTLTGNTDPITAWDFSIIEEEEEEDEEEA